jgi:hypothetical protein
VPPIDHLRACHTILTSLPSYENKQEFIITLGKLLQGDAGNDVQRILVDVSVALDRSELASTLPRTAKIILYDFESRANKVLATTGLYMDAVTVLNERMLGREGVAVMAATEFEEIATNVRHIADNQNEEQALYWRQRVKDFKFSLLGELKNYVQATQEAAHNTMDYFSDSNSRIMNKLLEQKQTAEAQQEMLISVRTGNKSANARQIEELDKQLLGDFLKEAAAGSSAVLFARRLQAMVERCLTLRAFDEPYQLLQTSSGRHWRGLHEVLASLTEDSEVALQNSQRTIDELIDVMDFQHLPEDMDVHSLIAPLTLVTKSAFAAIAIYTDAWLQEVRDVIDKTESRLHLVEQITEQ